MRRAHARPLGRRLARAVTHVLALPLVGVGRGLPRIDLGVIFSSRNNEGGRGGQTRAHGIGVAARSPMVAYSPAMPLRAIRVPLTPSLALRLCFPPAMEAAIPFCATRINPEAAMTSVSSALARAYARP